MVPDLQGGRIFLEIESESNDRWSILHRLIRSAHRDGFAGESVDGGAFYYAVFYKAGGIDTEVVQSDLFVEGVRDGGLLLPLPANNSLIVMQVPQMDEERHQRDFMPFHLWPLTKRAIFELHRGELVITVLTNPAQFVKRLVAAGFDVEHEPGPLTWDAITVNARTAEDPDGVVYHGKYQFVGSHITAAVNEFRSAEYVVDSVRAIISTFDGVMPQALAEQWARDCADIDGEPEVH